MSIEQAKFESVDSPDDLIGAVRSFDELYAVLDSVCPIQGSQKVYSADDLIDYINMVRNGTAGMHNVTRTYGLRQKVADLILEDMNK